MTTPQILVVDDEPMLRAALSRVLERSGFVVVTADCGAAALEVMSQTPVPMIISDMKMPGMTGLELLAQVQQRWPRTLRLVLTAEFDGALILAIQNCQVHRCVGKPWDNEVLTTLVRSLFEKFRN